jgi:methylmalonyl-CoA mutase cobalamin-binding subunit
MLSALSVIQGRGLMPAGRVAMALCDAGFEVLLLGMARAEGIAAAAIQEGIALVGLNVGGRIEVVERIVAAISQADPDIPIFAGGTLSPGSSLPSIVESARKPVSGGGVPHADH